MSEVNGNDMFKFVLSFNEQPILQRGFSGDVYEQITKGSINLRDRTKEYIYNLKKVLASKDDDLSFELMGYNLLDSYLELLELNNIDVNDSLLRISKAGGIRDGYYVNDEENFKFVLYYDNKSIIERNFYVKNYNPNSRFSVDLIDTFDDIVSDIQIVIKEHDIKTIISNDRKAYLTLN